MRVLLRLGLAYTVLVVMRFTFTDCAISSRLGVRLRAASIPARLPPNTPRRSTTKRNTTRRSTTEPAPEFYSLAGFLFSNAEKFVILFTSITPRGSIHQGGMRQTRLPLLTPEESRRRRERRRAYGVRNDGQRLEDCADALFCCIQGGNHHG